MKYSKKIRLLPFIKVALSTKNLNVGAEIDVEAAAMSFF